MRRGYIKYTAAKKIERAHAYLTAALEIELPAGGPARTGAVKARRKKLTRADGLVRYVAQGRDATATEEDVQKAKETIEQIDRAWPKSFVTIEQERKQALCVHPPADQYRRADGTWKCWLCKKEWRVK